MPRDSKPGNVHGMQSLRGGLPGGRLYTQRSKRKATGYFTSGRMLVLRLLRYRLPQSSLKVQLACTAAGLLEGQGDGEGIEGQPVKNHGKRHCGFQFMRSPQ